MQKERLVHRGKILWHVKYQFGVCGRRRLSKGGVTEVPIMWGIASCHKAFGFYCM